jgi:hypothetical protein
MTAPHPDDPLYDDWAAQEAIAESIAEDDALELKRGLRD